MDKLDLHEFLRIYVPGLYVSLLFGGLLFGSRLNLAAAATIAIFVGLAYSLPSNWLAQRYFSSLVTRHDLGPAGYPKARSPKGWFSWSSRKETSADVLRTPVADALEGRAQRYIDQWKSVVSEALDLRDKPDEAAVVRSYSSTDVTRTAYAHYARRYNSPELYSFRLQKTIGVLYWSLGVASIIAGLYAVTGPSTEIFVHFTPWPRRAIVEMLLLLGTGALFGLGSRNCFIASLSLELSYWSNPPEDVKFIQPTKQPGSPARCQKVAETLETSE